MNKLPFALGAALTLLTPATVAFASTNDAIATLNLTHWKFEVPLLSGAPAIAIGTWTFNFGPTTR